MRCPTRFVLHSPEEKLGCVHTEEHACCASPEYVSTSKNAGPTRLLRVEVRPRLVTVLILRSTETEDGVFVTELATA